MATLTLKNVPDGLYARLKLLAARNRRSLNQEAIAHLEEAVTMPREDADHRLAALRRFHESLSRRYNLEERDIDEWKRAGRP